MSVGLPEPEFIDNPENRCPVILLLDTSGSMSGKPIMELNRGVRIFKASVMEDRLASLRVEVAVITFNSQVEVIQDFVTIDNFTPKELTTSGTTHMGEGINQALDLLEERKTQYRENDISYYRPWLFLITDGSPTEPTSTWQNAGTRVRAAEAKNKLLFFAVGVEDADLDILKEIAPVARPPQKLKSLDFQSMFEWLGASVKQVSVGKIGEKKEPPPTDGWAEVII
ncbi:MAG: VWA domain-containing protein [Symploca sp. SIO3E6]|nr:VWA domain-containing protein [Caldora sp. SIO3E6]